MQSEERMVTKAEAPTLRATGQDNGGVQLSDGIKTCTR